MTTLFDGVTIKPELDNARLGAQMAAVWNVAKDGRWRIPSEWEAETGSNWASVSARLRDLRKEKWGGHTVQRRRREPGERGLFEYRLIVTTQREELP